MAKSPEQKHSDYVTKINNKFNSNIVVIGQFLDDRTPIEHYCIKHNNKFYASPFTMLYQKGRKGCLECSNKQRWTYLKLVAKLASILFPDGTPKFTLLTTESDFNKNFKGVKTRIRLRCTKDDYEWETNIDNLINSRRGCRRCSRHEEWDYLRLQEAISNLRYPDGSPVCTLEMSEADFIKAYKKDGVDAKILVRCLVDQDHYWSPRLNDLINNKTGCPHCYIDNKLWNYEKLKLAISELRYPDGSLVCTLEMSEAEFIKAYEIDGVETKIPVRCAVNQDHYWSPMLNDLINNKTGCPHCNTIGYSKAEIEWLEFVMATEGIHIQHAKNGGQISVCGRKVDGMCFETNSVYQFHGDYWHGNPNRYDQNKIHPKYKEKGLTYGDRYEETLIKDQELRDKGYNVIIMWESDWNEMKKQIKINKKEKK